MQTSAGVIIVNETFEGTPLILMGHATGQKYWDLPKGGIEEYESPLDAVIRETLEEVGVVLDVNALTDLGEFNYTNKKNLHLFTTNQQVDVDQCVCTSWFMQYGRKVFEMDAFKFVSIFEIDQYAGKSMAFLLKQIFKDYL